MQDRREHQKYWIQRGPFAVEVDIEVVYPFDRPFDACLEPETVRRLDEIAERASVGDVAFLQSVGRVFFA